MGLALAGGDADKIDLIEQGRVPEDRGRHDGVVIIGEVAHDLARSPLHRRQLLGQCEPGMQFDASDQQLKDIVVKLDVPVAKARLEFEILVGQGRENRIATRGIIPSGQVFESGERQALDHGCTLLVRGDHADGGLQTRSFNR
jgi:hypothetical protein